MTEKKADHIEPEVKKDDPPAPPAPAEPKLSKYVVAKGPLAPFGNGADAKELHGDKARLYKNGEVVELPGKLARHYVNLKRLAPYVDDED